jgi:Zn-dependent M28 family amino/carboxypeptidase
MRSWLFLAFLFLAVSFPVRASEPEAMAAKLRDQALQSNVAYTLVESLTTEVGPRLVGSPADAKAVTWGIEKLQSLGFENVHTEPVSFNAWVRGVETAEVLSPYPQRLVITALGGSVATPKNGLEADVVIFKSYDDLLKAAPGSLNGKIAMVTQRTVRVQDGSGYGYAGAIRRAGAVEAAKRGAVAYLIRSLGTSSHRFPHTGSMRYEESVTKIPAAAVSAPDAEQIERIASRGKTIRLKLNITPKLAGPVTTYNVIGDIVGSEKAEEVVIIGGHLDSWDLGTGAIDDAAGVAITTAAGKMIIDSGLKPKRTIRVIMFAAEEVGLVGANEYVRANKLSIPNFVIGAESDFGAGPIYQFQTRVGSEVLPAMKRILDVLKPLGIIAGDNNAGGGPDIGPFVKEGMPAAELQQNGLDYFDYHHTPDDTLDKINPQHLSQNVAAYTVFAWMAANLDVNFRSTATK